MDINMIIKLGEQYGSYDFGPYISHVTGDLKKFLDRYKKESTMIISSTEKTFTDLEDLVKGLHKLTPGLIVNTTGQKASELIDLIEEKVKYKALKINENLYKFIRTNDNIADEKFFIEFRNAYSSTSHKKTT